MIDCLLLYMISCVTVKGHLVDLHFYTSFTPNNVKFVKNYSFKCFSVEAALQLRFYFHNNAVFCILLLFHFFFFHLIFLLSVNNFTFHFKILALMIRDMMSPSSK